MKKQPSTTVSTDSAKKLKPHSKEKENMSRSPITSNNRIPMTAAEFTKHIKAASSGNFRGNDNNFLRVEISDAAIENQMLLHSEFNFSKLSGVTFTGVNFEHSEFKFAELDHVVFHNCDLSGVSFDFAVMNEVQITDSTAERAVFSFASGKVSFTNCSLCGSEFYCAKLDAVMTNCNCQRIEANDTAELTFHAGKSNFRAGEFTCSQLHGEMTNCSLADADFSNSDGAGMSFTDCVLSGISTNGARNIQKDASDLTDDDFDFDFE